MMGIGASEATIQISIRTKLKNGEAFNKRSDLTDQLNAVHIDVGRGA